MTLPWLRVAQAALLISMIGCGSSHERTGVEGDAGWSPTDGGRARDATTIRDGGRPIDAGPRTACSAADAHAELCPDALCDGLGSWHWNGERCHYIDCGACRGADCGLGSFSREECEAAHASCEPVLCRNTGGTWMWWAEECGHYECGSPAPAICEVGMPVCDCGVGQRFYPGMGCAHDPGCPEIDPLPTDVLCTSTGGTWGTYCCHSECGEYCGADCAAPACHCGPLEIFDPVRGCITGARCMERHAGETCNGGARCDDGTLCCDTCGGAGCAGTPTCSYPVCDDDETIDMCGNDLLAP